MHLKRRSRRAYSLVELLVVIAIIAILVALTTAAVMRFRSTGVGRTTKSNGGMIHTKLNDHLRGTAQKANKDSLSDPNNASYANLALANSGTTLTDQNTRANYVTLRQMQVLPTSFAEVFWPDDNSASPKMRGLPKINFAWPAYETYLANLGILRTNETTGANWKANVPLDVQCAICILMILEKGPNGGGVTADDLGPAIGRLPLVSGATTTVPAAVDGWRRPFLFTKSFSPPSITVVSYGNDGLLNTYDDIVITNP
jgi:prepilin-type N-terminal cleavage/methylation domain-containing protein